MSVFKILKIPVMAMTVEMAEDRRVDHCGIFFDENLQGTITGDSTIPAFVLSPLSRLDSIAYSTLPYNAIRSVSILHKFFFASLT